MFFANSVTSLIKTERLQMGKLINNLLKCYFKASFGILVTHVMPAKP